MSVRFIIGRSGTGKTANCLNEIRTSLLRSPDGSPIIYLVPDQMTFLSEYNLMTTPHLGGMIRAQVYSFSRLAWRILQDTGGGSRYHLNNIGVNMLIRKIIEEKKDELKLFQLAADKNGFIEQMEQILTEFKQYCIRPEELTDQHRLLSEENKGLQDKLHDLELIYRYFEQALFGKYVDSEDYFRLMAEKIAQSDYLKNAEIFIDGFHSFTPQEYMVITQLMKHCQRVSIALTVDQPYIHFGPDELSLFRMTGETFQTLYNIAQSEGIKIEKNNLLYEQKRWRDPSLIHLESYFDSRPAIPFQKKARIHLYEAANRRAEIEGVARKINKLIRSKGYRYRDIAILMRNGNDYFDIIETIFNDYGIPIFIDQKRTMLNHPLIELIRSTLDIINSNWSYESVFRAVKTELLFPKNENNQQIREKFDRLENYVLAYGIQGEKWTKRDRWIYRRFYGIEFENNVQTDQEKLVELELNELRLLITAPILRLARRLKRAKNGRLLSEAIFLYLEELDIPEKLEKWKLEAEQAGKLVKSREHDQAWNGMIELLDQFVELFGNEKLSLKQFSVIFEAGIESLRFSLVPPAIDQVLVADLEKSRLSDVKAAFIIGLNEGVLPAKMIDEGIVADDDREILQQKGLTIAPTSKTKLLDESFIAYKAFTTPSDELYLTYPIANEEGKALLPSFYIKRINDLFPAVEKGLFAIDPAPLPELDQLEYAANENMTLSYLTAQLQLKKRNYPIYDFWWDVYNYYLKSNSWSQLAKKVLASLFYENKSKQLSSETTRQLYGETIEASVSRMELFHSCPFSHFVKHGLKLRKRQVYRLEAPDIGELFHAALKYIADTIMKQNVSWSSLTKQQCRALARQAIDNIAPKLQNEILLSSNRHHYIKRKLENVLSRTSLVLSEHAKASGFSPVGVEVGFGPKGPLPPLEFRLKNDTKMNLVGRIDRIDKAEAQTGVFLRIVDYKSSIKDLNLTEVYYGLALQMLTYLDIIVTHANTLIGMDAMPAGVLYFHVHNPMIQAKKMLTIDELEQEIYKQFKMKGLMLADQNVIRLMDKSLDSGESKIVSAGIKKDGTLSKRSKVANSEQLNHLRHYVRNSYLKTGNEIMAGKIDISPYKLKNKTPCTFCSFKTVCHFDQTIEQNDYRILVPQKDEDIIEFIRREVAENERNEHTAEA
ncbi:helicase-exonuclease AddAB subunit AddB [Bacillus aquiflavi]|uniref:ATP-dependent helicase/deoxyribonuclease subunit B n=1 Tax=Bacillus aquiflavi TaxID=2672567 RepID=A0A6B3W3L1_9BACI|nr:helicase-exonuclease AddAB subunit AddB [Bacillus aquiflavi]MBA4538727.1 helicase-exonuclease AddAB subunit AddB [Bacillus aquiflavi]NEY83087.1 helicase-exonuclease AddAB subunit AddB [Bacillus aquiflavi]